MIERDGAFAVHWNILCFLVWPARAQPKPMSAKIALKKAHGDKNEDRKSDGVNSRKTEKDVLTFLME